LRLKGVHYREVKRLIEPGDILIRRFEGYVDKWLIPGWWNHVSIYVGSGEIVHAVSEGIVKCDLIDFMRTDHLIVLRAEKKFRATAVDRALGAVGAVEYDFAFDFKDPNEMSCTEFGKWCYPHLIVGRRRFGRFAIVADDFVNSPQLETVWDSREIA